MTPHTNRDAAIAARDAYRLVASMSDGRLAVYHTCMAHAKLLQARYWGRRCRAPIMISGELQRGLHFDRWSGTISGVPVAAGVSVVEISR